VVDQGSKKNESMIITIVRAPTTERVCSVVSVVDLEARDKIKGFAEEAGTGETSAICSFLQ